MGSGARGRRGRHRARARRHRARANHHHHNRRRRIRHHRTHGRVTINIAGLFSHPNQAANFASQAPGQTFLMRRRRYYLFGSLLICLGLIFAIPTVALIASGVHGWGISIGVVMAFCFIAGILLCVVWRQSEDNAMETSAGTVDVEGSHSVDIGGQPAAAVTVLPNAPPVTTFTYQPDGGMQLGAGTAAYAHQDPNAPPSYWEITQQGTQSGGQNNSVNMQAGTVVFNNSTVPPPQTNIGQPSPGQPSPGQLLPEQSAQSAAAGGSGVSGMGQNYSQNEQQTHTIQADPAGSERPPPEAPPPAFDGQLPAPPTYEEAQAL